MGLFRRRVSASFACKRVSLHSSGLRIALATCGEFATLDADDRLLLEPLRVLGVESLPAVWDDRLVDWSSFDAVLLRSTWDYPIRVAQFMAWAATLPVLFNPIQLVRWNVDKRYLLELELDGLPIVPTRFAGPGEAHDIPLEWIEIVVKPSISVGSRDTARYRRDDPQAARHIARLQAAGRTAMVQPYLDGVERSGETSLVYLDGNFSHAIRKGPLLQPGGIMTAELFAPEDITPRIPSGAELDLGAQVLGAVTGRFGTPLYARIDLLPGPVLIEVELIEPSLFLGHGPGSMDRLAGAIVAALSSVSPH